LHSCNVKTQICVTRPQCVNNCNLTFVWCMSNSWQQQFFMTMQTCTELTKSCCLVRRVLHNAVLYTRLITKTHKRCLLTIFMSSVLPVAVLHQQRPASCASRTLLHNHHSTGNCTVNFRTLCITINFVTIIFMSAISGH